MGENSLKETEGKVLSPNNGQERQRVSLENFLLAMKFSASEALYRIILFSAES